MKTTYKILSVALSILLFSACTDLDTAPQGGTITENQKKETAANDPSKVAASVNAIFSRANTYEAFSKYHLDFGYPSVMIMMDTRGYDFVSDDVDYNWFSTELLYQANTTTSAENRIMWNTMYALIHNTNAVAATIDEATTDTTAQFYLAQALGERAWCYFVLANLYQFTYKGNESKLCVPIITEKNMASTGVDGTPRATVQQVYDQILHDANKAVELLQKTTIQRADKRYISLEVAYGIRARVELSMENWAAAAADAKLAQKGYTPLSIAEVSKPGFNNDQNTSWMWDDILAETDRVVTSGIVNFASHVNSFAYGYANYGGWRKISYNLFNQIDRTDARRGWWLDKNGTSANITKEQAAFLKSKNAPIFTNVKFYPYKNIIENKTNAAPIPYMRVEEMILIEAEATAMAGNATAGAKILENFVKTYRDPNYTCTATTPEGVQDAVYQQRRIELWGEGLSWIDIKRLKKDMNRIGAYYTSKNAIFNIPANSDNMNYRLPESEITNNVQISEKDNNPVIAAPSPVIDNTQYDVK